MASPNPLEDKIGPLPFGLTLMQIPDVEIRFRVSSTKMFSGYDEIVIHGSGVVELNAAESRDAEPTVRTGKVERMLVMRLLQLLAAEGMAGWDELYPAESRDYIGLVLSVSLKDECLKQVAVCQPEFAEFSRAYGAVKLVASLAGPEVLSGDFFKRI
jgi:hypothetical protein